MESLQDKLDKSLVKSEFDKTDFLPQSSLDELITIGNIDAELRYAGLSSALSYDIYRNSRRVFAILSYMGMVGVIEWLYQEGFSDQYLPVDLASDGDHQHVISRSNDEHDEVLFSSFAQRPWDRVKRRDFFNKQWLVLSPVFATLGQELNLNDRCPLPFISVERNVKRGHFSVLHRVKIHHAHLQESGSSRMQGHEPYIAIKESTSDAAADLENLRATKELRTKHLIKAIATFQRGQRYHFMFPWADGGNLREFWENEDPHPLTAELIAWALQQLSGLAEALRALHNFGSHRFGRHGDIKPENILLFRHINDTTADKRGTLQFADLGLAKFHDTVTSERRASTVTMSGTRMYEPPETEIHQKTPRSRKYDIWSMGCVLLEFSIWLLYGMNEVERFRDQRRDDLFRIESQVESHKFYIVTESRNGKLPMAEVHPEVCRRMIEIRKDSRCEDDTALQDLLAIIDTCLRVEVDDRADSTALHERLRDIVRKAESEPSYLFH